MHMVPMITMMIDERCQELLTKSRMMTLTNKWQTKATPTLNVTKSAN